jgi:hypothetical protein
VPYQHACLCPKEQVEASRNGEADALSFFSGADHAASVQGGAVELVIDHEGKIRVV